MKGWGSGNLASNFVGFKVIKIQWLGDQAWRPLRGVVGRLCSPAEPAKVSLALNSAHLPTGGEGWAGLGFRVYGLGFLA